MQRDSNGGHKIPDFNPNWPNCMFCGDSGLHDWEGEWKFCRCVAGAQKALREPHAAEKANASAKALGIQK